MATPRRIASIKSVADFELFRDSLGLKLGIDDSIESGPETPLRRSLTIPTMNGSLSVGNRFAILPMEGWDGTTDGHPTDLTRRRWRNFGTSGAKLIWGGEAVAVRPDGRANPRQLMINPGTIADLADLRESVVAAHVARYGEGSNDDLLIGLQLTHSGRYARPTTSNQPEPRVAYRHPYLDLPVGVVNDDPVFTDEEMGRLVADFVAAACLAQKAGYRFVDVKHCHGYLGHELLSAVNRPGPYGGSLVNRSRFLTEVVAGIRAEAPELEVGVRLSLFDFMGFRPGADGVGMPAWDRPVPYSFGGDESGLEIDLTEVSELLKRMESLGIRLICTTAGSPYYNPHIVRPATFPPSDGYLPPEDPLVGVARQIAATAALKKLHPNLIFVGSGYSYLQDWLPHVAQRVIREGGADLIGLGRMVLSYPELPADVLAGRPLARKRICRTFSDCTTAPRHGIVSGCYPLDPLYKATPERDQVNEIKQAVARRLATAAVEDLNSRP